MFIKMCEDSPVNLPHSDATDGSLTTPYYRDYTYDVHITKRRLLLGDY